MAELRQQCALQEGKPSVADTAEPKGSGSGMGPGFGKRLMTKSRGLVCREQPSITLGLSQ